MANKVILNEERINKLVSEKHLTKRYLSVESGYADDYLSNALRGKKEVKMSFAKAVASILGVDESEIIEKEKEPIVQAEFMTINALRNCTDIETIFAYIDAANHALMKYMKEIKHE